MHHHRTDVAVAAIKDCESDSQNSSYKVDSLALGLVIIEALTGLPVLNPAAGLGNLLTCLAKTWTRLRSSSSMEWDKRHPLVSCGHAVVCQSRSCAENIMATTQECPACRRSVAKVIKIFRSEWRRRRRRRRGRKVYSKQFATAKALHKFFAPRVRVPFISRLVRIRKPELCHADLATGCLQGGLMYKCKALFGPS